MQADTLLSGPTRYVVATYFLMLQALVAAALVPVPENQPLLFWYCNNASFFLAIAALMGNSQLFKGITYVGIVTQFLWITDFLSHLFGDDVSHTADYIFTEGFTFANDVSVLVHFSMPVVALAVVASVRPHPRSLFYASVYAAGLWAATIAGTSPADDVNCIFAGCSAGAVPWSPLLWFPAISVLILASYIVHRYAYRYMRERSRLSSFLRGVTTSSPDSGS